MSTTVMYLALGANIVIWSRVAWINIQTHRSRRNLSKALAEVDADRRLVRMEGDLQHLASMVAITNSRLDRLAASMEDTVRQVGELADEVSHLSAMVKHPAGRMNGAVA